MAVKLTKNCRYLVRVRDYETAHVEVGAEISHFDIGYDDAAWAKLPATKRDSYMKDLGVLLDEEVDRLAREELATLAEWSEFTPNLAEDYLQTPPANKQRNQHATKTGSQPTTGRRLRRATVPSSSSRPA
jgi:acyl-CoA reductase-like NAD-dependent aldehyde dehydrogenase